MSETPAAKETRLEVADALIMVADSLNPAGLRRVADNIGRRHPIAAMTLRMLATEQTLALGRLEVAMAAFDEISEALKKQHADTMALVNRIPPRHERPDGV